MFSPVYCPLVDCLVVTPTGLSRGYEICSYEPFDDDDDDDDMTMTQTMAKFGRQRYAVRTACFNSLYYGKLDFKSKDAVCMVLHILGLQNLPSLASS